MSDSIVETITLEQPLQHGKGELITELNFREVTGADLEDFPLAGAKMGDYQRIAARLTGHPASAIKTARGKDIFAIAAAIDRQLAGGQEAGET